MNSQIKKRPVSAVKAYKSLFITVTWLFNRSKVSTSYSDHTEGCL